MDYFLIALYVSQPREFVKVRIVDINVASRVERMLVEILRLLIGKEHYSFLAVKP